MTVVIMVVGVVAAGIVVGIVLFFYLYAAPTPVSCTQTHPLCSLQWCTGTILFVRGTLLVSLF